MQIEHFVQSWAELYWRLRLTILQALAEVCWVLHPFLLAGVMRARPACHVLVVLQPRAACAASSGNL
jgi:hypothetical protein